MSRFIFPYGIRFQENGRIEVFPAVELFVFGKRNKGVRTIFHIDSGATTSVMPASDEDMLGIHVRPANRWWFAEFPVIHWWGIATRWAFGLTAYRLGLR